MLSLKVGYSSRSGTNNLNHKSTGTKAITVFNSSTSGLSVRKPLNITAFTNSKAELEASDEPDSDSTNAQPTLENTENEQPKAEQVARRKKVTWVSHLF